MKTFEKIVKAELLEGIQGQFDPLQFAYRPGRGVEDAVATLLHSVQSHLHGAKNFARLVFIDFSSAFNCIQPRVLAERLTSINIDQGLICWLIDFLTDRPQKWGLMVFYLTSFYLPLAHHRGVSSHRFYLFYTPTNESLWRQTYF